MNTFSKVKIVYNEKINIKNKTLRFINCYRKRKIRLLDKLYGNIWLTLSYYSEKKICKKNYYPAIVYVKVRK